MIKESKASGLTAEGAFSHPREPEIVLISVLLEIRDDSLADHLVVLVDLLQQEGAELGSYRMVLSLKCFRQVEQPPRVKPFREHIP